MIINYLKTQLSNFVDIFGYMLNYLMLRVLC